METDNKNIKYWYLAITLTTSLGNFAIIMGAGHKFNFHNFDHKVSAFYLLLTLLNSFVIFSIHKFWKIISFFTLFTICGFYAWVINNLFSNKIENEDFTYIIIITSILTGLLIFSIYMIWRLIFSRKW